MIPMSVNINTVIIIISIILLIIVIFNNSRLEYKISDIKKDLSRLESRYFNCPLLKYFAEKDNEVTLKNKTNAGDTSQH